MVTLTWAQILFVTVVILGVYALEMAYIYWRLSRAHFTDRFAQVRLQQLERAVEQLLSRAGSNGEAAEQGDATLENNLPTPYSRAIALARDGLGPTSLANDCGISRGEAELIVSLYGPGQSP